MNKRRGSVLIELLCVVGLLGIFLSYMVFWRISDDVAAARRAWALPCVPGIQGFKILRFKYLRFKDSRIPAVKKFKIVQKSEKPAAKSQQPKANSQ